MSTECILSMSAQQLQAGRNGVRYIRLMSYYNTTASVNGGRTIMIDNTYWGLILQTIRDVTKQEYSINVGMPIYQPICYVLTRNGVNTGFAFDNQECGPYSEQAEESLAILEEMNLIIESPDGVLTISDDFVFHEDDYTVAEINAVKNTVDLFCRVQTETQAELVANVLFCYDLMAKAKAIITDKDVYDYIRDHKPPRWKNNEIRENIDSLAMLSYIRIQHSEQFESPVLI